MTKEVFVCDECGAERKGANHWFLIFVSSAGILNLMPWKTVEHPGQFAFHYCGQVCAGKAVDRFLSTGKVEK